MDSSSSNSNSYMGFPDTLDGALSFPSAAPGGPANTNMNMTSTGSKTSSVAPAGATVSVTATTRMKTYGVANVPQQTRHARRIYVGGVPPNYIDEDGLRDFFNAVIAQGLGEENDHSYVLSVYVDQKKCFSFVELKSIELATACLALDGIVMKNIVLRILRANEYKPELIPHTLAAKTIHLDLTGFQFGVPTSSSNAGCESAEETNDKTLDSLIQCNDLDVLEAGSVIIVGYPYDESHKKPSASRTNCGINASNAHTNPHTLSCAHTPRLLRQSLRRGGFGCVENAEYDVDLSSLRVLDIGDVIAGKTGEDTRVNLVTTVSELIVRGGIPVIVGGSNELIYSSVSGLMTVCGGDVSALCVSAGLRTRLLDDSRFCRLASAAAPVPSCDGRFVLFGAQGSQLCRDEAKFIESRNGRVLYLSRDLRANPSKSVAAYFEETLLSLSSLTCKESRHSASRVDGLHAETDSEANSVVPSPSHTPVVAPPVVVCIDAGALQSSLSPHSSSSASVVGLRFEEVTEMARLAGKNPQVAMLALTEFVLGAEDAHTRTQMMVAEILYHFLLGLAERSASPNGCIAPYNPRSYDVFLNTHQDQDGCVYMRGPFNCATSLADAVTHTHGLSERERDCTSVSSHSQSFSLDRSLSHSLSHHSLTHTLSHSHLGTAHNRSLTSRVPSFTQQHTHTLSHAQQTPAQRALSAHSLPSHNTSAHNMSAHNINAPHNALSHHTLPHTPSHLSLASRSSSFYSPHNAAHNAPTQQSAHTQQPSIYRGLSSHSSSFYFNNNMPSNVNRNVEAVHPFDEVLDLGLGDTHTHTQSSLPHTHSGASLSGYNVIPPHNAYTQASAADFGLRPEYR